MTSRKIHLFRKSAAEAGIPCNYYLNPSEKLMSRASEWSAVEHEDCVETIFNFNIPAFKDANVYVKRYNNQAVDGHLNTDFLNLKDIKAEMKNGISKTYYPKIKGEEEDSCWSSG
ncbi:hypothetical protein MKX01_000054 [Papaver californicum]|nr:hypothetical protein MKX01_000054 [Papaver californicum]